MAKKYLISSININFRTSKFSEISFERVTPIIYDKFLALKTKQLDLGNVAYEDDVEVMLNGTEWTLTIIKSQDIKKLIALHWEFLPHSHRIEQCIEDAKKWPGNN